MCAQPVVALYGWNFSFTLFLLFFFTSVFFLVCFRFFLLWSSFLAYLLPEPFGHETINVTFVLSKFHLKFSLHIERQQMFWHLNICLLFLQGKSTRELKSARPSLGFVLSRLFWESIPDPSNSRRGQYPKTTAKCTSLAKNFIAVFSVIVTVNKLVTKEKIANTFLQSEHTSQSCSLLIGEIPRSSQSNQTTNRILHFLCTNFRGTILVVVFPEWMDSE